MRGLDLTLYLMALPEPATELLGVLARRPTGAAFTRLLASLGRAYATALRKAALLSAGVVLAATGASLYRWLGNLYVAELLNLPGTIVAAGFVLVLIGLWRSRGADRRHHRRQGGAEHLQQLTGIQGGLQPAQQIEFPFQGCICGPACRAARAALLQSGRNGM